MNQMTHAFKGLQSLPGGCQTPTNRFVPARGQEPRIERWLPWVTAILETASNTPDRATMVNAAARALDVSTRTVRRLLARYEVAGDHGLGRAQPSDAGKSRVVISRHFDQWVADPDTLAQLSDTLDQSIKSLWKSSVSRMGSRKVAVFAGRLLAEQSGKLGLCLPDSAFKVPRKRVLKYEHYRIVEVLKNDRKGYADHQPCVFHGIVGADSTGTWARFPRDGGHGFHGIVGAPAEGMMEPRPTV